ncbi:MAG: flavodoxin family protein [Peptococcaceae bacterium]
MVKVLGLVGSRRLDGNSRVIVDTCLEVLKNCGFVTELIFLNELKLERCKGCLSCVYKGGCSIKDDMEILVPKIVESAGLIVAAPTYIFSPAAVIKTLIDRCMMITPYLDTLAPRKRYAVCLSIAGNPAWNPLGLVQVNQLALGYGYKIIAGREIYAAAPGEVILQEAVLEEVKALGQRLADSLQGKSCPFPVSPVKCPFCNNQVFKIKADNKVQCVTCGTEGELDSDGDHCKIKFAAPDHSFFLLSRRKEHVEGWMTDSRVKFLKNRAEIQDKLKQQGRKYKI